MICMYRTYVVYFFVDRERLAANQRLLPKSGVGELGIKGGRGVPKNPKLDPKPQFLQALSPETLHLGALYLGLRSSNLETLKH